MAIRDIDLANALFQGTVSFVAILVAVVGILIVEYQVGKERKLGVQALKEYKVLTWAIVAVLCASILLSLLLLFKLRSPEFLDVDIAVGIFVATLVALAVFLVVMVYRLLR